MNWGNSFGTTIGPRPHIAHESRYGAGVTAPSIEWPRSQGREGSFRRLYTVRVLGTLYDIGMETLGGRESLCGRRRDGRAITTYHGDTVEEIVARIRRDIIEGPPRTC
jgi:hypothetical protein